MTRVAHRLALGLLVVVVACACNRTTEGATVEPTETSVAAASSSATSPASPDEDPPSPDFSMPAYGVVPTTKRPLAAGEATCEPEAGPGARADAKGAAPGAPTVVVTLPDGFTSTPGQGDEALTLTGPDGMTGAVTIAPTTLDAEAAFEDYADRRTADASINSVSLLPGELCGYSGQELIGILADRPGDGVDYADRIVHVWTNAGDFLVSVQLEAPNGAPGFDAAKAVLLADFGIRMP